MKQIFLKVYPDGKTTTNASVLNFDRENNTGEIVIDFSLVDYLDWTKQLDLVFSDGTHTFVTGDGNTLTVPLLEGYLKRGFMTVQPVAKRTVGESVEKVKWDTVALRVRNSLNVLEDNVVVPIPIAIDLQEQIDEIELKLLDTNITNLQDKDLLIYDNATQKWINDDSLTVPRYDDIVFELTQTRVGSNSKPDYDFTNIGLLFPRNDVTEIVYITVQMPHAWQIGSTIYPHLHIVQSRNEQATFRMEYKWYDIGDTVPTTWSTYDMNTYAMPYTSGSISNIVKGSGGISGIGKGISSILKIKLFRNDNVYVGDILADQFDIHILKDSFGSQLEYEKD
jgi:hypothetical protein